MVGLARRVPAPPQQRGFTKENRPKPHQEIDTFGLPSMPPAHHSRSADPQRGHAMIELLEQQKRLTSNQWKLICTANLADLLDFFDFFLIGYVTAALTKQWSLNY